MRYEALENQDFETSDILHRLSDAIAQLREREQQCHTRIQSGHSQTVEGEDRGAKTQRIGELNYRVKNERFS